MVQLWLSCASGKPSLKESERFRKETTFSKHTCHSLINTQSLSTWDSFEDLTQQCIAELPEFIGTCGVGSISMYFCFVFATFISIWQHFLLFSRVLSETPATVLSSRSLLSAHVDVMEACKLGAVTAFNAGLLEEALTLIAREAFLLCVMIMCYG